MMNMDRRRLLKQLAMTSAAVIASPALSAAGDEAEQPKNNMYLNQLGYLPNAAKIATYSGQVSSPSTLLGSSGNTFRVRASKTGQVVYEGKFDRPIIDPASGDVTRAAEFSSVKQPGTYHLESSDPDITSDPFEISSDVYANALRLTMRAYYGQRCGCAVDLGGGYKHPACHLDGAYHASSGRKGKAGNHGGWHDAGDYGRYVVNSGITCGTLLYAWELYLCEHCASWRWRFLSRAGKLPTTSPKSAGTWSGCCRCRITRTAACGTSRPANISARSSCRRMII